MAKGEFDVRLPVESRDEFGVLARGFNDMAEHLQESYRTLEGRVAEKTRSLAEQNGRLATLYEMTAFLNAPNTLEGLCRGFLARLRAATGADGRRGSPRCARERNAASVRPRRDVRRFRRQGALPAPQRMPVR